MTFRKLFAVVWYFGFACSLPTCLNGRCRNRIDRHCGNLREGSQSTLPYVEEGKLTILFVLFSGFLFLLMFMGVIKGLIGLFCIPAVGAYGLNLLIDLPRPLPQYQEKELEERPVVYDIGGWPIHPDTLQKTVRILPKRTEFCLNIVFFLAYPLAAFIYLCALCCCIKNYRKSHDNVSFKHVNIVRLTNKISSKDGKPSDKVYGGNYKEEQDTKYVLNNIQKSKESVKVHQVRAKI